MTEKFDVIIVGAGPAGIAAALVLAQAEYKVAVFERGERPGSKNMFGGMLYYTEFIDKILPDFWSEAPIERYVTKHHLIFTSPDSSVSVCFDNKNFSQIPYNAITLLRAKFDRWFAQKAQDAGALIVTETTVHDFVYDGSQIIGIKTGREDGEVFADAVIIAEGANSLLVSKAGLLQDQSPEDFTVAVKELLALPEDVIEERINIDKGEGACYSFVGDCISGVEGGGFLFTNKNSLSVGVAGRLSSLQKRKISIAELLEHFKNHSSISHIIKGAQMKEYSGHLIPEGGIKGAPLIFGDGVLVAGDAAGFLCSTGITLQGMNYAIASGFVAAEAFKKASEARDFSKKGLSCYKKLLEQSFVLPTLQTFQNAPMFLANPRIYSTYPSVLCGVFKRIYKAGDDPGKKLMRHAMAELRENVPLWKLVKDTYSGVRALLW